MITISLPTPLVIFGEYLETYNQPCLSIPINNLITYNFNSISTPEIKIKYYNKVIFEISQKIEKFLLSISQTGLEISFNKSKVDPITFTIAAVEAISKIYILKFNKEQIYDACLTILSNIKTHSNNLKAELSASIWRKTCFLDGQNLIPEIINTKNFPIQIFKLNQNSHSNYFNKLNNKKNKYPQEFPNILDNLKYITNSAKIALFNSNPSLLADNLNKYQKLLDNLMLCDGKLHKYFVSAILAGASGLKFCTFFDQQFILTIIPEKNIEKIKKKLLNLDISEMFQIYP